MASKQASSRKWTVDDKVRIIATAATLSGDDLATFLHNEDVEHAELDRWQLALEEGGEAAADMRKRVRSLERELMRKPKG